MSHPLIFGAARAAVILLTALVTYLALVPYPVILPTLSTWNDKVQHALAFFLLTFGYRCLWRAPLLLVVAGLLAYGVGIELLQTFVPNRQACMDDLLADVAGIIEGLAVCFVVAWRRRERSIGRADRARDVGERCK